MQPWVTVIHIKVCSKYKCLCTSPQQNAANKQTHLSWVSLLSCIYIIMTDETKTPLSDMTLCSIFLGGSNGSRYMS